jgi:two-component system, cell cycle sensor histidine kinase and response regulator CckA
MTPARVLIVEDERIVARDIHARLERLGYTPVGTTRFGDAAVAMAGELQPDIVLMDIRLAGDVDGIAAAIAIRERLQLPVIFLTAYADESTLARARVTEPFGYILKPFDERELSTVIEMALFKHAAERRLRESERRFAVTLNSIGDAVIATDSGRKVTFVNPAAAWLIGHAQEDAVGQPLESVFRICHEITREPIEDPAGQALRLGRTVNLAEQTVLLASDGREVPIDDCAAPIVDDRNQITGAVLVFHNVTDKRRAEEQLRASEEKYRGIFNNAVEGIFQTTPSGRILTANPAIARMLGYADAAELMATVQDLSRQLYVDPERRAEFARLLDEHGVVRGFECEMRRKDGSRGWASLSSRAVKDAHGLALCYEGTAEEITERKRLEEQVRQSQKMEAIGQLAGGVAHDFNNMLTVINGFSAMAFDRLRDGDPIREFLAEVQRAGERAALLTRQLLAFSRKQVLELRITDLNTVIEDLGRMLRRLIGDDIELTIVADPQLGSAKLDPGQFEQVLMNLAVNARDAMPTGGRLTIETGNVELDASAAMQAEVSAGSYVRLAVSDTGHGMDDAIKARIFEPFFTTKGAGAGTGLGLSVVHGIVRQSGGFIDVSSAPGRGTAFRICVPRVKEKAAPRAATAEQPDAPRGTETILLADDDDGVRLLASAVLRASGYTVLEARDGEHALDLARAHQGPIHLLLSDVVMPKMGGRQLAATLVAERPGLRTLFVSGYDAEPHRQSGPLAGEAYLAKPFGPTVLASRVREVLREPGRRAASHA